MKKLLLTTFASVICLAFPAAAQETAAPVKQDAYLSVRMGASRMNMKMDGEKENKNVFSLSGAIGKEIASGLRAELELTAYGDYEENESEGSDTFKYTHNAVNFSLNVLKDFDAGKIKPYVGGGLGFAVFSDELKYDFTDSGVHYWGKQDETNTVFSANIQAGVQLPVTDFLSVDVNARYTYFDDYKVLDDDLKMENNAVSLTAGVRLNF